MSPAPSSPSSASGPLAESLTPDILGDPWVARHLPVRESPRKAPGAHHAVLVHQHQAGRAGVPRHAKAVLYIHGHSDYFFQTHLAQAYLETGYEFYALELRSCARAGIGHPRPHSVRDLRVHDEEIAKALHVIRTEHGHATVVLNGHSTGGLQAVIWAADHPATVQAVVLNSPWLDLQASAFMRSYGTAFVDLLSRHDPDRVIPDPRNPRRGAGVPDVYVRSLHQHWEGEWDWDLALKPAVSLPARAGFLTAVRRLHREVHHGLGIQEPVLLCCSTTTGPVSPTVQEAQRSDVVLSVEQMLARAPLLGPDVTVCQVPEGVHDLSLSRPAARAQYLASVTQWLRARLG
ncbi:alpha/beta hydrolase [Actinomyces sp. 2119]|uniref:Alpha/beta hydrolase n=1 Tax=Actinomyces lilanjuaniae TaxID=2321394 RepID=A0ABN5PTI3_9ACTO|nr:MULTISPECIES: alpha/beta hydrolase [Actinomyces]AYD90589.1 alpha/beta hydrolase [Actinomyces lilanjuaniae]RJF43957.1 alpha/beta hydrolase [Actinomyces sp. 2119]